MLEVHGLSHAYGRHKALDEVSIRLRAGEAVAILGANGAGKTTLLNSLAGLVRPTAGSIGLSPRLSGELFAALGRIAHDVSILMVEQNARRALAMADRAYLLVLGRIVGEGEADLLARDSAVARSYLGL